MTARVIQGLITGVGFIGAGAVIKRGNLVYGTATAASIWIVGAVGAAVGVAAYGVATAVAILTFLTLRFLAPLKPENPAKATGTGEAKQGEKT